jgi:4-hydroxy-L-threonine phosphate dehydrogenase PdxA
MSQEYKPIHAVTMGDPAGSGPEIVTKTLADPEVSGMCRSVVIGDAATMEEALKITGMPGRVRAIKDVSEAEFGDGVIEVLDLKNVDLSKLTRGEVNTMAGAASFDYIDRRHRDFRHQQGIDQQGRLPLRRTHLDAGGVLRNAGRGYDAGGRGPSRVPRDHPRIHAPGSGPDTP